MKVHTGQLIRDRIRGRLEASQPFPGGSRKTASPHVGSITRASGDRIAQRVRNSAMAGGVKKAPRDLRAEAPSWVCVVTLPKLLVAPDDYSGEQVLTTTGPAIDHATVPRDPADSHCKR